MHTQKEEDRLPARSVAEVLEAKSFSVPGIERLVNVGPNASQLRFFRKSEAEEAKTIVEILSSHGVKTTSQYIPGYEASRSIRPRHYELWFAPGEPPGS